MLKQCGCACVPTHTQLRPAARAAAAGCRLWPSRRHLHPAGLNLHRLHWCCLQLLGELMALTGLVALLLCRCARHTGHSFSSPCLHNSRPTVHQCRKEDAQLRVAGDLAVPLADSVLQASLVSSAPRHTQQHQAVVRGATEPRATTCGKYRSHTGCHRRWWTTHLLLLLLVLPPSVPPLTCQASLL